MNSSSIISGCWIVFLGYWLVSWLAVKRIAERQSFQSSLAYRIPVLLGAVLFWNPSLPRPLNMELTPHPEPVRAPAAALCVCGDLGAVDAGRQLEQPDYLQARPRIG